MEAKTAYTAPPAATPLPVECQVCDYGTGHPVGDCPCQQCYQRIREQYRHMVNDLQTLELLRAFDDRRHKAATEVQS